MSIEITALLLGMAISILVYIITACFVGDKKAFNLPYGGVMGVLFIKPLVFAILGALAGHAICMFFSILRRFPPR